MRLRSAFEWLAPDGALLRRMALAGSRRGPAAFVRVAPPAFGVLFALLLPAQRGRVRSNLRRVLGERPAARETLDVFRTFVEYACCLTEALAAGRPEAEQARRRVLGKERLTRALERGGAVVVTAHVGAWDAAARLLAADTSARVMVVMRPERSAAARRVHDAVREGAGVRIVHVGDRPTDALPLLAHLREGGVVAIQLDRLPRGQRALEVELFGEPARIPEGPFRLAALAGAPLVPLFARRAGFFDYELEVGEPLELPRRADAEALRGAAERVAALMERFIRANPTQWFDFAPPAA
ncbi:MAG: lysophospholipid acyltransferase family protein [Sorangiineae bacterium]|nr:lysophospholipid acyltransferase family protein [Polyangiaceae bacterium]MEB2323807.1 lysophospholipid acyltransferase family protein [Sorangiineae bacterium]